VFVRSRRSRPFFVITAVVVVVVGRTSSNKGNWHSKAFLPQTTTAAAQHKKPSASVLVRPTTTHGSVSVTLCVFCDQRQESEQLRRAV